MLGLGGVGPPFGAKCPGNTHLHIFRRKTHCFPTKRSPHKAGWMYKTDLVTNAAKCPTWGIYGNAAVRCCLSPVPEIFLSQATFAIRLGVLSEIYSSAPSSRLESCINGALLYARDFGMNQGKRFFGRYLSNYKAFLDDDVTAGRRYAAIETFIYRWGT